MGKFTATYKPGTGYMVKDGRGRILGSGLTKAQADRILDAQWGSVLSSELLGLTPVDHTIRDTQLMQQLGEG